MANQRQNFTTVSFELRRDSYAKLKQLFPKYGQLSRVMRHLVNEVLSGKLKIK